MSFKDDYFSSTIRVESLSSTDFLASAGGLIGLFMGASLLSIIEMFYYFSIRIFLTYRKDHPHNRDIRISMAMVPFKPVGQVHPQPVKKRTFTFAYLP